MWTLLTAVQGRESVGKGFKVFRLSQAAFCLHLLVVVTAHKSGWPSRKSYFAALMDEQGEAAANSILHSR